MKNKKIPALCLSGGRLKDFGGHRKVAEYRFWIHPNNGDDFYYRSESIQELKQKRKKLLGNKKDYALVEPVIAVVFDERFRKYREVVVR
jgi:hypothetical protein